MKTPFFSIIIPCFNSERTIREAIDSIIQQDYSNFEILIIDGLSEDNTIAVINNYNDERINFFSEVDQGIYDAMNKGLKKAKGQWLYFLGSDDYFYNQFVLADINTFINSHRTEVVYGDVKVSGDTGWAKDGEIYAGYFSKYRMLKKAICHQAIFYKRDFLIDNNLSFDLRYFVSADWDFNMRCRRISKFKYLNIIVAVFKAGGVSSTKIDSFRSILKSEYSDFSPSKIEIFLTKFLRKLTHFIK